MKHFGLMLLLLMFPMCIWAQSSNVITSNGVGATITFSSDGSYEWTWNNSHNRLQSSNYYVNSSSSTTTIIMDLPVDSKISFDYGVSSELGYDKLTISLDGNTIVDGISGDIKNSYRGNLSQGEHSLVLIYSKDYSMSDNEDMAYISNLMIGASMPSNCLYYTSIDDCIIDFAPNCFDAEIISNTYAEGKGIVTFSSNLTRINNLNTTSDDLINRKLTGITVPPSVVSVHARRVDNLNKIDVDINNPVLDSRNNCNAVIETASNKLVWGCKTTTIPNTVTSIGSSVFTFYSDSPYLKLYIPSSVTVIDNSPALCNCFSTIEVATDNPVYDSRNNCNAIIETSSNTLVLGCKNTIIPQSVTSIGDYGFYRCQGLTEIIIPNGVTAIGKYSFMACSNLKSIQFPKTLVSIGYHAFAGVYKIESIIVDEDNPYIRKHPSDIGVIVPNLIRDQDILYCLNSSKQLPNDIDYILNYYAALENPLFPDLASHEPINVIIPSNVKAIMGYSFSYCNNIESVTCYASTPPRLWDFTLEFTDLSSSTLYVPYRTKELYVSEYSWKDFGEIIEMDPVGLSIMDATSFCNSDDKICDILTYSRTFNNTTWQALYVPFSIPVVVLEENGLQVAELNDSHMYDRDDDGVFEEVTIEFLRLTSGSTEANMPYMIRALEAGEKQITLTDVELKAAAEESIDCSTTKKFFTFTGTYSGVDGETMFANHYYAISGGALKPAANSSVGLKPQRWYMSIENRDGSQMEYNAPSIRLMVNGEWAEEMEEETTGLHTIGQAQPEGKIYTLEGMRVLNASRPGMYVQNGKIVVRK